MNEPARNLLVGLFVIASITVLSVLMVWFGEAPEWLGGSEWELRITGVRELSGIEEGSPVNLNGVQIGRVTAITFENPDRPDQGVVVVTRIKLQYSVPQGAIAKVYGATFGFGMGNVEIVVQPGVRLELLDKEYAEIRGEMHNVLGEIINKGMISTVERTIDHIGELAAAATPVAENLAELLEQRSITEVEQPDAAARGVSANLSTIIERIDQLLANVNEVLGDDNVQGDVKAAVGDLKLATQELRETFVMWKEESRKVADNLNEAVDRTERNLDESFGHLNRVLENLDTASKSMAVVLQRVERGEGTAGMFVRDERLYQAAALSLERLSELVGTLQRITSKIEEDGYISLGRVTPVGTFTKDFPVGEETSGGD